MLISSLFLSGTWAYFTVRHAFSLVNLGWPLPKNTNGNLNSKLLRHLHVNAKTSILMGRK